MHEITIGDKTYKIHTDADENPVKVSRYNHTHKLYITLSFSSCQHTVAYKTQVQDILKSLYLNGITQNQ